MILAVYGSLKNGKHNHRWLNDAPMLGETKVRGTMYLVHGSYPVIMDGDSEYESYYVAEVYDVDDVTYNRILAIEEACGYAVRDMETEYGTAKVFYGTDSFDKQIASGEIKKIDSY